MGFPGRLPTQSAVAFVIAAFLISACSSDRDSLTAVSTTATTAGTDTETAPRADRAPPTATSVAAATTTAAVAPTTASPTISPSSTPSPTSSLAVATTTADDDLAGIQRPYLDPSICEATTRWGGPLAGERWNLFSRPSEGPVSMQILADRDLGPTGPYALLLRYHDRWADVDRRDTEPIGVFDVAFELGSATTQAFWNLPDGGEGLLRSRGLGQDDVIGLLETLALPTDAAVRGFAVDGSLPSDIALLHEGIWQPPQRGTGAGIECVTPEGGVVRVGALHDAEPLIEYAFVADRPAPLSVGYRLGSLVVINGFVETASEPTVADVVSADEATWNAIPTLD